MILVGSLSLSAHAQWGDEQMADKPSFTDRMFFGGGLGLSFSSNYDYFSVSPIIGYRLSQKLATGLSIIYRYNNYKYVTPAVSTNDYGVSPFLRYQFYGPLFLHAEYEYLNNEYITNAGEPVRKSFTSFIAGGGFFQPISRHAGFYVTALYNFSYHSPTPNDFYPYSSPWILRAGITAGF
jgi:outer membrane protein assembly factor BamA